MSNDDQASYPVMESPKPEVLETHDGVGYALLPEGWTVANMESITGQHAPRYRQGTARVYDIPSLAAYVERFAEAGDAVLYVDAARFAITCVLDDAKYDPDNTPRRADRVVVEISQDPRFLAWKALCAKPVGKKDFVRFIEMNDSHFHEPNGAQMRSLATQLEVTKTMTFTDVEKMTGAARDVIFRYETATKEQGEIKFPSEIWLKIPIFQHQAKAEIPVRLYYDLEAGALTFTLRIPDENALVEAAWDQVRGELEAAMGGGAVPILNGVPPEAPKS